MAPDPRPLARLARLTAEIAVDRGALAARAEEVAAMLDAWTGGSGPNRAELTLLAANLHGYYTALETLCERVARQLDETVPTGPAWHADLLSQMHVEVPGLRPVVVPAAVMNDLHELRRFRHFFRNAYVLEFDPVIVRGHAERLRRLHAPLASTIDAFAAHLRSTMTALADDR